MVKIHYEDAKIRIMNHKFEKKNILIEGKRGSGKTTLAIEKYKHMIETEKIPSEEILVLLMNSYQSLRWRGETTFNISSELRKLSYFSFVQRALIRWWPMVIENCKEHEIKRNFIRPKFASFDVSNYMMRLLIDYFRKKKGYLSQINGTSSKIAKDFLTNINQAALSLIPFHEIGERVYYSMEVRDLLDKKIYEEMDEIIGHYRERFIKNGILDYGLSIHLYHQYLLRDERYKNILRKEIKYLIVDNVEEASAAEMAFINEVITYSNESYLFYNPEGGLSQFYGADTNYINQNLKADMEKIILDQQFVSHEIFISISNILEKGFLHKETDFQRERVPIYMDFSSQLRSEMIHKIKERILHLIDHGENPKDMVIITPFSDLSLMWEIKKALENRNIPLFSTVRKERLKDHPYVHSLIVLACLCKGYNKIILTEDDLKSFFLNVLDIDLIRASLISRALVKNHGLLEVDEALANKIGQGVVAKYYQVKFWIEEQEHRVLPLDELFRRAYLEIMITLDKGEKYMGICNKLINVCENFIDVVGDFDTIHHVEEKFISFIKESVDDFQSIYEIEEILYEGNYVILTTPSTFIHSNMESKIQIWTDVNHEGWFPRNIREFTNPRVLRTTWDKNSIYTDKMEDENRVDDMIKTVKALMGKCRDKIYMYGSEYGINGYEEHSQFSSRMMEILEKAGDGDGI